MRSAAMDFLLTEDARLALEALALLGGGQGYLLGHRRGPRFIVEGLVPAAAGRAPSGDDLRALERVFGRAPVGFYSVGRALSSAGRGALRPFACGRLWLEARSRGGRLLAVRGYLVDYDGAFRRVPVPPAPEPERRER